MTSRQVLVVYAALALLCAFYPALFSERPAPLHTGAPFLPDSRRPPEANDELIDVATQLVPWSRAVADAYGRGRLPLRFASNGCGTPLWGNPQAQAMTPTTLLFLVLPPAWASAAGAAVKLFAAAAGAFFFARTRRLSTLASVWVGLVYGFAIHATAWMHFPLTWPVALLPWVLLALERLARGRRRGFAATLAVVILLLLGGYPEGELLVAGAGAGYFAALLSVEPAARRERLRRLGLAVGASLLALGVTAAYVLPAAIAIMRSERSAAVARGSGAVPPESLLRGFLRPPIYWSATRFWVVPEAQGNPRDHDKFGPYSFAGRASGYAGVLILAFALATFFWKRPPRFVAAARWAAMLIALYMLWYPPLVWLLHRLPGVREAALRVTTNRAGSILVLFLALLAAFELDRIRGGGSAMRTRAALGVLLVAAGLVALEYKRTVDRPTSTAWRDASFVLPVLLLTAAIVLLAGRWTPRRATALAVVLLGGTALDLLKIGARFNPGTRPEDEYPVTAGVRAIRTAAEGGRFVAPDPLLSGLAFPYGLEDVRALDPLASADYQDALAAAAGYRSARNPLSAIQLDSPFLDFLNARARTAYGPVVAKPTAAAILPDRLVGVRDRGELHARLANETDFLNRAFVLGSDETFSGDAALLAFQKPRPEELRIRVHADSPRVVVVPESDDGGWTASAGGDSLPTFRANGAFLGIRIPAGESDVLCRYVPPGLRTGTAISAASLLALLALLVRTDARSSSRSSSEAATPRGAPDTSRPSPRPAGEASASAGQP